MGGGDKNSSPAGGLDPRVHFLRKNNLHFREMVDCRVNSRIKSGDGNDGSGPG
jgi:hypothetical protein